MLRKPLFTVNQYFYHLTLRLLGIHNYDIIWEYDERLLLRDYFAKLQSPTIFDVGANQGDYTTWLKKYCQSPTIYSFEPNPASYAKLSASHPDVTCENLALSDAPGELTMYDDRENRGCTTSSIYSEYHNLANCDQVAIQIKATTLDQYCEDNNITKIDLLKLDVEGHERFALAGAQRMLAENKINCIQLEFSEADIPSRTYFKDFYELLPDYEFYRMLPKGLAKMGTYDATTAEIFSFYNVIAIHKSIHQSFKKLPKQANIPLKA